jgi:uncharacterized protein (DUF1778 family)
MGLNRIQVYADAETKRRIELAAAKRNVSVTNYCLDAIVQQLGEDQVLEEAQIEIAVKPTSQVIDEELIAQMQALTERFSAQRGGKPLTGELLDIVEQVRAERDEELATGPSS